MAENSDSFTFEVDKDNETITFKIPANNAGKFRFKTRTTNIEFGSIFATKSKNFNDTIYLEWQIGYDAVVTEVTKGNKTTTLTTHTFIGANNKNKYLYELSEFLYNAILIGLVSINDIKTLLAEIEKYTEFIEEKKIEVGATAKTTINGIAFEETDIKLPTWFMLDTVDGTQVEISTQKQQYASGVQPMVYFCIPIKSFNNYTGLIGRPSKKGDILNYEINKSNAQVLFNITKIFAMLSKAHNHDVKEILKVIITLNDLATKTSKQ